MLQNTNGSSARSEYRYYAARTLLEFATNQPEIVAEANKVEQSWPVDDIPALIAAEEKARGAAGYINAFMKLSDSIRYDEEHDTPISGAILKERILPLYSEALDSGNQQIVDRAISVLWDIGSNAAPLLPKLIKVAEQDDHYRFGIALGAMTTIAPGDPATLPFLLRLLNDTNTPRSVTYQVCAALTDFGPEAAAAVPGLHKCLGNHDIGMKFNTTFALWRIGKEPPSVKILQDVLKNDEGDTKTALRVLEMLRGLNAQTAETKSILHQLAKSSIPEVQTSALALLETSGASKTTQ
jgi:hypothetical protein